MQWSDAISENARMMAGKYRAMNSSALCPNGYTALPAKSLILFSCWTNRQNAMG